MARNQKGFSMVAALALAAVLGIGAMLLGQVLAYLKAKKLQTQARVSAIGYEDSLVGELIPRVVAALGNTPGSNCEVDKNVFVNSMGSATIPGTSVNLRFIEVVPNGTGANPNRISSGSTTLTIRADINGGVAAQAGQPAVDRGPEFINNPADISFRLDFLNKAMSQDQKMFGPFVECETFMDPDRLPREQRQIKVSYGINWSFRGKEMNLSGSKLVNLAELGL